MPDPALPDRGNPPAGDRAAAPLPGSHSVAPYRPGLPWSTVARGTLARFLPGAVLGTAAVAGALGVVFDLTRLRTWLALVPGVLGVAGALAGGFGIGLAMLRKRLYPDARVDGRRSLVAGLLAPLLLFSVEVVGVEWVTWTLAQTALAVVLVGLVLALVMFFAWLTPTPDELR